LTCRVGAPLIRIAPVGAAEGVVWGAWFVVSGMDLDAIRAALKIEPDEEESAEEESRPEEEDEDPASPSTLCTSLVGAKGLSAEHVFIFSLRKVGRRRMAPPSSLCPGFTASRSKRSPSTRSTGRAIERQNVRDRGMDPGGD
jgi:hypothetical protein